MSSQPQDPRERAWAEFYASPEPDSRPARLGEHPDAESQKRWEEFYREPNEQRETSPSTSWAEFYGTGADGTAEPGSPKLAEPAEDAGAEVGAANHTWQPDLRALDVADDEVDGDALAALRKAEISDAHRSEIASAFVAAQRAEEAHSVESGMAALHRMYGSDAKVGEAIRDAQRALSRAPQRVRDALERTGAGNDPLLVRALARAGRALRTGGRRG